jgi:hypothetical protein
MRKSAILTVCKQSLGATNRARGLFVRVFCCSKAGR